MGKTRDEYLQLHWTRYPAMPVDSIKRGRVGSAGFELASLQEMQMSSAQIKARDVLQTGDLVAIVANGEVLLLAPNLTSRVDTGHWSIQKDWQDFLQHVRRFFFK